MKKKIICMECNRLAFENKNYKELENDLSMELNNDGYYITKCDKGHEFITVVQQLKFELLFDMGAMSLNEGNTRAAVVNFASAFERFLEFCIEIFSYNNDIDTENFNKLWKILENHSERQLGAYYLMYLNTLKEQPLIIDSKKVNFRNKVIHKGYIPSILETTEYGEYLFNFINSILDKIRDKYEKEIMNTILNNVGKVQSLAQEKRIPIVTSSQPTIISIMKTPEIDFKSALESAKSYRNYVYAE